MVDVQWFYIIIDRLVSISYQDTTIKKCCINLANDFDWLFLSYLWKEGGYLVYLVRNVAWMHIPTILLLFWNHLIKTFKFFHLFWIK